MSSIEYTIYSNSATEKDHVSYAFIIYEALGENIDNMNLLDMYNRTRKQTNRMYDGKGASVTIREVAVYWMCSVLSPGGVKGRTWRSETYNGVVDIDAALKLYNIPAMRKMIFDSDDLVYHGKDGFARRKDRLFADENLVVRRPVVDIMKEYTLRNKMPENTMHVQVHHSLGKTYTDKKKQSVYLSRVATQLPIAISKHTRNTDDGETSSFFDDDEKEYCVHVILQLAGISNTHALSVAPDKTGARLQSAIIGGDTRVVGAMINRMSKPKKNNQSSNSVYMALAMRTRTGSREMLETISNENTFASLFGSVPVPVKLPKNIDIPVETYSNVPLFFCIAHQKDPRLFASMLSMFLKMRRDILDQHPKDGNFVLYAALHTTNKRAIQWLLERTTSALVWKWKEFETPIHYAIRAGNHNFVTLAKRMLDSCNSASANMYMSSAFGPMQKSVNDLAQTDRKMRKLFME